MTHAQANPAGGASLGPAIRLRAGVKVVDRGGGRIVLAVPGGAAVRVSSFGRVVLGEISAGATFPSLCETVRQARPESAGVAEQVSAFVGVLDRAGCLESSAPRERTFHSNDVALPNPDRAAAWVARRLPGPLPAMLAASLAALAIVGVVRAWPAGFAFPRPVVSAFDWGGLALFVLCVVPLHEFAHAVTCRAMGAPVLGWGLRLGAGFFAVPFVDTSEAYFLPARWPRFAIPMAGPLMDLLGAGAGAWLAALAGPGSRLGHAGLYLMTLGLLFLYLDLNPFAPSDGSHMIEALLNDELARRTALGRRRGGPEARAYRRVCVVFLMLTIALFWPALRAPRDSSQGSIPHAVSHR